MKELESKLKEIVDNQHVRNNDKETVRAIMELFRAKIGSMCGQCDEKKL